eukprot:TRINITY_DN6586_c0_g2_i2.p1 TRINITY_DN6586_c0_g2~~TRINITY_DN6586_c0_g2_i2.p1  ORF type:complete len:121 (+),score=39.64 TRINITY_DN6586_c0_g2_i2:115-477(+)
MEERKKQNKKREGGMLTSNAGLLMNNGNFVNLNLIDRGTKIDGLERNARVRPGERGDDEVSEGDIDDDIDVELTTKIKAKYEMQLKQERAKQGKTKKGSGSGNGQGNQTLSNRAKSSGNH